MKRTNELYRGACGCYVRISLAPPCGCCVLCPSCAESSPLRCAKCNTPYEMQAVDDPDRRAFNDDPKWPVPHELIEWQPAFVGFGAEGHRGGGAVSAHCTHSRVCSFVYFIRST